MEKRANKLLKIIRYILIIISSTLLMILYFFIEEFKYKDTIIFAVEIITLLIAFGGKDNRKNTMITVVVLGVVFMLLAMFIMSLFHY